jgi:hypothetical protein
MISFALMFVEDPVMSCNVFAEISSGIYWTHNQMTAASLPRTSTMRKLFLTTKFPNALTCQGGHKRSGVMQIHAFLKHYSFNC